MERTVYVNMSKARLLQILRELPSKARRNLPVQQRIATALFTKIRQAFDVKTRGGTDETGDRWPPLAPSTIAKRLSKPGVRPSGSLTANQRAQWWSYYRSALFRFKQKHIAARIAWAKLKRDGVTPGVNKYGNVRVDILQDTKELVLSLSPYTVSANKVQRFGVGEFTIGTRREGAGAHHKGTRRVPQRRLWPDPRRWSSSWWDYVLSEAREGCIVLVLSEVGGA